MLFLIGRVCSLSPPSGCPQEIPSGAQEQRGESGEVSGRAEEAAQEEPGQQEPVQVRREGDAGEACRSAPLRAAPLRAAPHRASSVSDYCGLAGRHAQTKRAYFSRIYVG